MAPSQLKQPQFLMQSGTLFALAAYLMWGLFPLYFRALQSVPALELMLHRLLWSFVFLALLMIALRQWRWLIELRHKPKVVGWFAASGALLSFNWYIYVWAVHEGHVLESSLGYFINPLVNVLFGALFFHERMRKLQWASISLAALGVLWLTLQNGRLPWIALLLAITFGVYGVLRKIATLGALEGQALETLLMFPFALGFLIYLDSQQPSAFVDASSSTQWLIMAAGPISVIPLMLFAVAVRRIPLTLLGLLQYIGPTMQFFLGVWVFNEPFDRVKLIGFIAIWVALVLYSLEGIWHNKRSVAPEVVS